MAGIFSKASKPVQQAAPAPQAETPVETPAKQEVKTDEKPKSDKPSKK